jgi:DNA-3-methyladenine glycosylase I
MKRNAKPSPAAARRCHWAKSPAMVKYHDTEWGVPTHDDRALFEFLILEGAQAGLSWETILNKRENYRKAFDRFNPAKIARYHRRKVRELLANAGIVRNRLKIAATISNAQAFLALRKEFGTFDKYIWQFVGGKPKKNSWSVSDKLPASTPESDAMCKDLKARGFRFVGSTVCYAFMQATGMVNDHARDCFRRNKIR